VHCGGGLFLPGGHHVTHVKTHVTYSPLGPIQKHCTLYTHCTAHKEGIQNTEYRTEHIQNTELIQNTEHSCIKNQLYSYMPTTRYWILDTGYWILDTRYYIISIIL
jgi:hypothetical protein